MLDWLVDPYESAFMRRALAAALLVGVMAPAVGVWLVLRRLAYLGDAMSHSVLLGVGAALLLGASLTVGALGAGIVVALAVGLVSAHPRLREDTVIGVVETAMFGLGVVLIARESDRFGVNLDSFLFGQILAVNSSDLAINAGLVVASLVVLSVLFADLRLATFDPIHAALVDVRVRALHYLLLVLLAIAIVVSLQTVGLLMSIAMLITPPAAARVLTSRVTSMALVAVALGVVAAVVGLTASYHLGTPPGASVAIAAVSELVLAVGGTAVARFGSQVTAGLRGRTA
jgi:manganese/iron transport system permease protein